MSHGRCALIAPMLALLAACTVPGQKPESSDAEPVRTPSPVEDRTEPPAPPPQAPAPVEIKIPGELDRALAYFDRLRRVPAAELPREQEAVRQAFTQSRSDFDRMRLAMTYALPNTPLADEGRVLDLLDPLVKNSRAELHPLAVLMGAFAQEHKRLASNVQALQQGVQSLQQKLDALRSLERSLTEREAAGARRK